jgi:hypothetical protein
MCLRLEIGKTSLCSLGFNSVCQVYPCPYTLSLKTSGAPQLSRRGPPCLSAHHGPATTNPRLCRLHAGPACRHLPCAPFSFLLTPAHTAMATSAEPSCPAAISACPCSASTDVCRVACAQTPRTARRPSGRNPSHPAIRSPSAGLHLCSAAAPCPPQERGRRRRE